MTEVRFQLTPLTPLHIGSGENLEPFEYVMAGNELHRFTVDEFMLALPTTEQAAFVDVVARSIASTRRFVAEHANTAVQVARWRAAVSPAARGLYDDRLAGEAHPEVRTCIRTSERPYLPASSLKGAMRTALLYHAMDKPHHEQDARRLEQAVFQFRRVQEDPFRAFKLGDGQPLAASKVRAVTLHKRHGGRWDQDVALLVETVPGLLSDGVEESSVHAVRFDDDFYRLHQGAFRLTPGRVLAACRDFYGTHLAAEQAYTAGLPQTAAAYGALVAHAEALPDHACLVRLAWGSGRDATTVSYGLSDERRPISRRLSDDGFPLGWAELSITGVDGQPIAVDESGPAVAKAPRPTRSEPGRPRTLRDLQTGMVLSGRVTHTVNYGAFVDLGVGRDGLIHISKLADHFVRQVEDVVKSGDRVQVEVIEVDVKRRRISLKLLAVEGR
jgi:CRISPR type III-A-associated RAMP protein Csm5